MCQHCVKEKFPRRESICLETGSYFLNFAECNICHRKDTLIIQNRQVDEEDGQEVITYQHTCGNCEHVIASHEYRFESDAEFQTYEMQCLLCGHGEDERSVMPDDPRQQPFF